ncbi:alpha/beta-hydrolase, partial [Polyporus arcularius HHB13444]
AQNAQSFLAAAHRTDAFASYDAGLFTPIEDLHTLSASQYTTLRHPSVPHHSVRIKQSRFCDGEAQAYTGYIDIEARHLFFYFFESRRDPDKDDVVFWTNGGPGGSSSLGLFMELGPCRVTSANTTKRFEYAWNEHANIFFIDQPVDVGFSYADYGEQVSSTPEAAMDISAFMIIFFEHFTKFKGRPFHMAGESYGGRYIPVFAAAIHDKNAELIEAGLTPINLTSVMIGNGATDFSGVVRSYYDIQCMDYGFPAVTSIA